MSWHSTFSSNGQRVEQRVLLEQHPDVVSHPHQLVLGHRVDALAVDADDAGVRFQQTEDQFEDDGLPGSTRPDHDRHMPGGHGKTDVAQNDVVIEGQADMFEHDGRHTDAGRVVRTRRFSMRRSRQLTAIPVHASRLPWSTGAGRKACGPAAGFPAQACSGGGSNGPAARGISIALTCAFECRRGFYAYPRRGRFRIPRETATRKAGGRDVETLFHPARPVARYTPGSRARAWRSRTIRMPRTDSRAEATSSPS